MSWTRRTGDAKPIENLAELPLYAPLFFFCNLGGFRPLFWVLTFVSVLSTLVGFFSVYLLGDLITTLTGSAPAKIFTFYLPLILLAKFLHEALDYFTRRYGEAFPAIFGDFVSLRLSLSVLRLSPQRVANLSPQRLQLLISKYAGNVAVFADAWFWTISRRLTELAITICVLTLQSPIVLAFNAVYFSIFLWISLRISRQFSKIASKYSEQNLNSGSVISGFSANLSAVRRLGITDFFLYNFSHELSKKWDRFDQVRRFHARRWLLQLNLYNFGYIATLAFGAYQVQLGQLSLGYLVLIKYAFDTLYNIFVWIIEYYVSLVQQREDGRIIRREFSDLTGQWGSGPAIDISSWRELKLSGVRIQFEPSAAGERPFAVGVPDLRIHRGSKIGVLGPSGSGKSSLLGALLNLVEYDGEYSIDGRSVRGCELMPVQALSLVSNTEPLFPISLRANLSLGKPVSDDEIRKILRIVCADEFVENLDATVGNVDFNLSAGQQQRVRLARGLLQDSSLYLLDEPFNGIDELTKLKIIARLRAHLQEKAIVLVTHNEDELALVDAVYKFHEGALALSSPAA